MQYACTVAESFWNYLMRITNNATGVAISRAAEVDAGNVSRWKTGKTAPSAESVVKIARTWGRSPVEALVASGHLTKTEVDGGVVEVGTGLGDLDDDALLAEVRQRIRTGSDAFGKIVEVIRNGGELQISEIDSGVAIATATAEDGSPVAILYVPGSTVVRDIRETDPLMALRRVTSTYDTEGEQDDMDSTASEGTSSQADEGEKTKRFVLYQGVPGRDFITDPIIEEPAAAYDPPGPSDSEEFADVEDRDPEGPEGGA